MTTTLNVPPKELYHIFNRIPDELFVGPMWINDPCYLNYRQRARFGITDTKYNYKQLYDELSLIKELKNTRACTPREYSFRYHDIFWYMMKKASNDVAIILFKVLCDDLLEPLTTEFCDVDWEARHEYLKRAAKIVNERPNDPKFLKTFLEIFLYGSRYIEESVGTSDDSGEVEAFKLINQNLTTSDLLAYFFDEHGVPNYVDDLSYWVNANEDAFYNIRGITLLVPYVTNNIQGLSGQFPTNQESDRDGLVAVIDAPSKKALLEQVMFVIKNKDSIEW